MEDAHDITPYIRLTAGKFFANFFPNLYIEYGHSSISSKIDSTLTDYVPESLSENTLGFPIDLDRDEDYLKTGINLMVKLPLRIQVHLEYNYIRLFREDGLDYINYNHVFKADIDWFIKKWLVLNIGGVCYDRQFNGVIPFLYNEHTQTTFDHRYGMAHIGITCLFGGD